MENIKTYIETGILEQYVLGELTSGEMLEVEAKAAQYAEVRAELSAIEQTLEKYAFDNAVNPPQDSEQKIFSKLGLTTASIAEERNHEKNVETKIIPLESSRKNIKLLRFALVACVALLVISVAALFITYNKLNDAHQQIASLNVNNQKFAATVSQLEYENTGLNQSVEISRDKNWSTIRLAGVKNNLDAKMDVYWNKKKSEVMINYTAMSLPTTDTAHQFQLWALVNGKPVSLGVFGGKDLPTKAMVKMQGIDNAQAFAVTEEPTGGSASPTMEKMVVLGNV